MSEHAIQAAIVQYLRLVLPAGSLLHHSPNEEMRPAARRKAKELGTEPGWPDIEIMLPSGRVWFLEVKAPGKYPNAVQRELHDQLRACGHTVDVVRSIDDVEKIKNERLML